MRWVLWPRKLLAKPSVVYLPMRGPRFRSTPSVNAPATPCTTSDAIESWKPNWIVSQPPELQPQAASMIQTTEPRIEPRMRKADSRTRSMSAPDMIEAVVHEKRRKARKKTRVQVVLRGSGPSRPPTAPSARRSPGTAPGRRDRPASPGPIVREALLEAAVDVPADVVERRRDDRDREDVLHRRRHEVLASRGARLVGHEARRG